MSIDPSWTQPWQPQLNWNSPAGELLERLAQALPAKNNWRVVVFGSAPLQLAYDPAFLSADVDLFSYTGDIENFCEKAGLLKGDRTFYIDPLQRSAFRAPEGWEGREFAVVKGHVTMIFPHPIDLLSSKVQRMDRKDFRAFELVRRSTGHPTDEEMIWALRLMLDIFRPSFDEENASNVRGNVKQLWRDFFNRDIDISSEIIRPAVLAKNASYRQEGEGTKNLLSDL